jgi:hypothetical protein
MNFLKELFSSHKQYWGIPYPHAIGNRPVQTCYECGANRDVKVELHGPTVCKVALPIIVLEREGRMFGNRVEGHFWVGEKLAVEGTQTRARKAAIAVGC